MLVSGVEFSASSHTYNSHLQKVPSLIPIYLTHPPPTSSLAMKDILKISKGIMIDIFPKLLKTINLHTQEAQQTPSRTNSKVTYMQKYHSRNAERKKNNSLCTRKPQKD